MATSSDIATLALKLLGVVPEGENPTSAQALEGTDAYARLYSELSEDGFNLWSSSDIPTYVHDALARCVVARIRPIFQTTDPALHEAETLATDKMLKAMLRRRATQAPIEICDF